MKASVFAPGLDSAETLGQRWQQFTENTPDKPWQWESYEWNPNELCSSLLETCTRCERWGLEQSEAIASLEEYIRETHCGDYSRFHFNGLQIFV